MPTLVYRKRGRPNAFVFGAQETPITIGRNPSCVIVVESVGVSRQHAELRTSDEGMAWEIVDLGSANGTWVNGERVSSSILRDKDSIVCGDFAMEFRRGPSTGRFHMTGPDNLTGRRASDSGSNPAVERPDAEYSTGRVRSSSGSIPELKRPHTASPSSTEDNLDGNIETAALLRRIAALEARNASLLDEVMLLRGTLIETPTTSDEDGEFPEENTDSGGLSSRLLPDPASMERYVRLLPSELGLMLRSVIDLETERNAMLERFLEAVIERFERAGKP